MPKFLIKERASTTKPELKLFILYILLIIIAETITYLANAVWGILIHASLLISLLVLSALSYGSNPSHRLFLSLALAPVIRITSLSLPTQLTPPMRYLF
ncbi:hypothetical protein H5T51_09520, partial [Candidatus Bathyarchaeota archaeon]|nr:hypothetical protein [Candidatus Bathyarchaeota archaeon]